MKLTLKRIFKGPRYTIGKLFINGVYECDTLEDHDRGLTSQMSLEEIKAKKVYGETAIPTGTYSINMTTVSPKFSKYPFYKEVCEGKLPRLLNVKGYEGILIHVADGSKGADLVLGCIGIGKNKIKGGLLDGKETFKNLISELKKASNISEPIFITIE